MTLYVLMILLVHAIPDQHGMPQTESMSRMFPTEADCLTVKADVDAAAAKQKFLATRIACVPITMVP